VSKKNSKIINGRHKQQSARKKTIRKTKMSKIKYEVRAPHKRGLKFIFPSAATANKEKRKNSMKYQKERRN
jgi:hypothetical protein